MSNKKLDQLKKSQLQSMIIDCKESLMNYRFQKVLQQLEHSHKIKETKRELAQLKTILKEFDLGIRKGND